MHQSLKVHFLVHVDRPQVLDESLCGSHNIKLRTIGFHIFCVERHSPRVNILELPSQMKSCVH